MIVIYISCFDSSMTLLLAKFTLEHCHFILGREPERELWWQCTTIDRGIVRETVD